MVGARFRLSALAIAPLLAGVSAHAADYNYPPPPPPVYQPPPIIIQQPAVEFAGNWYLRGQVGVGMMGDYKLSASPVPTGGAFVAQSISDAFFVGAGVGYEWNNWLRFDVTAEYRSRTRLTALGALGGFGGGAGPVFVDNYEGYMKSYVFLANAYVDLGTWDCFTPFVGVGVGAAYNMMTGWQDVTPLAPGGGSSSFGVGRNTSQWNMAWALYAGVTYNVTKTFKVDLSYRYLNLGSASEIIDCDGGCGGTTLNFKNLYSHDFMLAFRWTCCEVAPPPPRYVYQPPPPPPPPPPPLHSKG